MTQIASLLAVATVFIGLRTLFTGQEGGVIAATVARRLDCGEDTDSNADLDIDRFKFQNYIYIFAGIKYCDFDINRKIHN